jgi:hypothetical protein
MMAPHVSFAALPNELVADVLGRLDPPWVWPARRVSRLWRALLAPRAGVAVSAAATGGGCALHGGHSEPCADRSGGGGQQQTPADVLQQAGDTQHCQLRQGPPSQQPARAVLAFEAMAAQGAYGLLAWVQRSGAALPPSTINAAIIAGYASTARRLHAHLGVVPPPQSALCAAVVGDIATLSWLVQSAGAPWHAEVVAAVAALLGRVDVLEWMAQHANAASFQRGVHHRNAQPHRRPSVGMTVAADKGGKRNDAAVEDATGNAQDGDGTATAAPQEEDEETELRLYVPHHGQSSSSSGSRGNGDHNNSAFPWLTRASAFAACAGGNTSMAARLRKRASTIYGLALACEFERPLGHNPSRPRRSPVDTLKWLRLHGCVFDEGTMATAIRSGNVDTARYLHDAGCAWPEAAINEAARCGHTEMLLWMRDVGMAWDAITFEFAAAHDQVAVMQLLRDSGCAFTEMALVAALVSDSIEAAAWLVDACGVHLPLDYMGTLPPRARAWLAARARSGLAKQS